VLSRARSDAPPLSFLLLFLLLLVPAEDVAMEEDAWTGAADALMLMLRVSWSARSVHGCSVVVGTAASVGEVRDSCPVDAQ
jgi:hypothetical protein